MSLAAAQRRTCSAGRARQETEVDCNLRAGPQASAVVFTVVAPSPPWLASQLASESVSESRPLGTLGPCARRRTVVQARQGGEHPWQPVAVPQPRQHCQRQWQCKLAVRTARLARGPQICAVFGRGPCATRSRGFVRCRRVSLSCEPQAVTGRAALRERYKPPWLGLAAPAELSLVVGGASVPGRARVVSPCRPRSCRRLALPTPRRPAQTSPRMRMQRCTPTRHAAA